MTLKEFMKTWKVSERDIIEAVKLVSKMHTSFEECHECPCDTEFGCIALPQHSENVGEDVKKRIQEILRPNHMEKVAEVLGVKIGETFSVRFGEYIDNQREFDGDCYLYDEGLHIVGQDRTQSVLLEKLLDGNAYIEREANNE